MEPILGMQAGGYSKTWEWEEVLTYPIPLTAGNAGAYCDLLLAQAFSYLNSVGFQVEG